MPSNDSLPEKWRGENARRLLAVKTGLWMVSLWLIPWGCAWAWINPGFETGDLTGWDVSFRAFATLPPSKYYPSATIATPGIATYSGGLNAVHSGGYSGMLYSGYSEPDHWDYARIEQEDAVSASAPCLSIWFAGVLNTHHFDSGAGSTYGEDTYINFELLVNGATIYSRRYSAYDNASELVDGGFKDWKTLPWKEYYYDLSPYIGQQVTMRLTAYDCNESGHYCYGYIDDLNWVPLSVMPTNTPTWSPTDIPTVTSTPSRTPALTATPTFMLSPTPEPTMTWTPPLSTATCSRTPTTTDTLTDTPSCTSTPTRTWTMTPTPSPAEPPRLWPNPYYPSRAVHGTLKCEYMPVGSALHLYTISGERVGEWAEVHSRVEWDGKTDSGRVIAPGIYYYYLRGSGRNFISGVLLVK